MNTLHWDTLVAAVTAEYDIYTAGDDGLRYGRYQSYIRLPASVRHAIDQEVLADTRVKIEVRRLALSDNDIRFFVLRGGQQVYPKTVDADVESAILDRAGARAEKWLQPGALIPVVIFCFFGIVMMIFGIATLVSGEGLTSLSGFLPLLLGAFTAAMPLWMNIGGRRQLSRALASCSS